MVSNHQRKVLILGHRGKLGSALLNSFTDAHDVVGLSSDDFDAASESSTEDAVRYHRPDILLNTVAQLGIDPCEDHPMGAIRLNCLYPTKLAELSEEMKFVLVHFSSDAVFNDEKHDYYVESDIPDPVNCYGLSKLGGDRFVQLIAERHYLVRIPVLFGPSRRNIQFVEKMINRMYDSEVLLRVSNDIVTTPSYSLDVAEETLKLLQGERPYGLYHITNTGMATLYDLICEIAAGLGRDIAIEPASYKDFPFKGMKNTYTPLRSERLSPMRSWQLAVRDYCSYMGSNTS